MIRELIDVAGHHDYLPAFPRDQRALEQARKLGLPWMARYTTYDGPDSHCHGLWGGTLDDLPPGQPGPNAIPLT
jgi:hypothetical protein